MDPAAQYVAQVAFERVGARQRVIADMLDHQLHAANGVIDSDLFHFRRVSCGDLASRRTVEQRAAGKQQGFDAARQLLKARQACQRLAKVGGNALLLNSRCAARATAS